MMKGKGLGSGIFMSIFLKLIIYQSSLVLNLRILSHDATPSADPYTTPAQSSRLRIPTRCHYISDPPQTPPPPRALFHVKADIRIPLLRLFAFILGEENPTNYR
jgi:hypothetical protein